MKKVGRPKKEDKKVHLSTVLPKEAKTNLRIIAAKLDLAIGDTIAYLVDKHLKKDK